MISVLILTLNEEQNIEACLKAVAWSDDVVVFDSFSTDRTVEIARGLGARVIQRRFDNENAHRTAALQAGFRHRWVFNPDADEICTPELRDEMLAVVKEEGRPEVAYRCRFRNMFMGKWVRRSSMYPTWVMRLFRPEKLTFNRNINLNYVAEGPEGRLRSHFEHYSFNNGFNAWFDKHNRYSWQEAKESLLSLDQGGVPWRAVFSPRAVERRRGLKELSFRLPGRPFARFLYVYLVRLGFLDGRAGLTFCVLQSIYEYMIVLKMRELRRRARGLKL
jgi:glycosyltransferase involved in cell wall biosynthesis